MESRVSRRIRRVLGCGLLMGLLLPSVGAAQSPPAQQVVPADTATSRVWVTAGVSFTAVRGDCQTCEDEGLEFPFRRSASIFGTLGYRVNDRMDVGAEILWVPVDSEDGTIRTTHYNAIAQFRPWASQGFFLKGGAGMAFVRNWVDLLGPSAINSKALSLVIGGGWAFRPRERVGLQLSASQHVAAMGDFERAEGPVQDVIGNFWSLGVAIVIR
jgi:hypothetical protein